MKRPVRINVRLQIEQMFTSLHIIEYLAYMQYFITDENEDEDDVVEDEIMNESESSMQNVNEPNTNESIVEFSSNDDSIIPETQDCLSQDSNASLSHDESHIESESELEQTQSNSSVVSICSHEVTQLNAADEKSNLDENRREIDVNLQASTTLGK